MDSIQTLSEVSRIGGLSATLVELVVCPLCKKPIDILPDLIQCRCCGASYLQHSDAYLDLTPCHFRNDDLDTWTKRQQEMEQWYKHLIEFPADAAACLANDYAPHAAYLNSLGGVILDIGGGRGIVRHYLPAGTEYIVIDPSIEWLRTDWSHLRLQFPCLERAPCFVRGVGECLPFRSEAFNAVLAFWSLNHAIDPGTVFAEAFRTLLPGGRFRVVLEDMVPGWADLLDHKFPAREVAENVLWAQRRTRERYPRLRLMTQRIKGDWPLQNDHIRIQESDIELWSRQRFIVRQRTWINHFLTLDFEKLDLLERP